MFVLHQLYALLAAAVMFWGQHGYTNPADATVRYGDCGPDDAIACTQRGGHTVTVDRALWALLTPRERCIVMVHEDGHVLGFGHTVGGIMDPKPVMAVGGAVPGVCRSFRP